MSLPSFVLIGVPRSGTTSAYRYLTQHPAVFTSSMKESNFLAYPGPEAAAADYPWMRFSITTFEEYEGLYEGAGSRVAVDVSPACFHSPVAPDRIGHFLPDSRLLVLLRDPVSRAYSAYLKRRRNG